MLVELAIGDAYGASFEFARRKFVREKNDVSGYVDRGDPQRVGRYTDDTQMSLAIAEVLVSGEEFTPEILADWFIVCYKRDPRPGYARGFRAFLESIEDGQEFLAKIQPHSSRSGAAMRAMPLGVLQDLDEIREKAQVQAALTHNTLTGRRSAMASALMTHYFLYDVGPKKDLGAWVEANVPGVWAKPHSGKVGLHGAQCVRAAITALQMSDSMTSLLANCIAFTGDVDTVASIALAAAAGSKEIAQDLPASLVRDLEDGSYGRSYIEQIDNELLSLT